MLSSSGCPVPVQYSADTRQRLADAIAHLPPESVLINLALDYFRLRAEAKACQESGR